MIYRVPLKGGQAGGRVARGGWRMADRFQLNYRFCWLCDDYFRIFLRVATVFGLEMGSHPGRRRNGVDHLRAIFRTVETSSIGHWKLVELMANSTGGSASVHVAVFD